MNVGCYGKQGFQSKPQAEQIMKRTNRRRDQKLNVYRCTSCGIFHIGAASVPRSKRYWS